MRADLFMSFVYVLNVFSSLLWQTLLKKCTDTLKKFFYLQSDSTKSRDLAQILNLKNLYLHKYCQ